MTDEDRYIVPGGLWLLTIAVIGAIMWTIGIVTVARAIHWIKGAL